jgi:hypothetical protein
MAVQQIIGKQITKYDTEKLSKNPNFVQPEKQEVKKEIVSGNNIDNKSTGVYKEETNVYGEKMESMMNTLIGKIDNIKVKNGNLNVYDENTAVDVDIKRNVFLSKADDSNVKIDNVKNGKVNNKLDKLRALRKNGS